jgi:hypothetical protein
MLRPLIIVVVVAAALAVQPILVDIWHPEAVWLWCDIARLCVGS